MCKNHGCISEIDFVVLDQQSEGKFTITVGTFSEMTTPTIYFPLPDHRARDIQRPTFGLRFFKQDQRTMHCVISHQKDNRTTW
jgi:hypothetical protein